MSYYRLAPIIIMIKFVVEDLFKYSTVAIIILITFTFKLERTVVAAGLVL